MPTVKKHSIHGLTAYYLKKGRNWWVETEGDKKCFKSIEDMVDAYLELLEIEAIKTTFERRKLSREFNVGKVEIASITELMPYAAAPYVPDAFSNTQDGRGITWGLAHFINVTSNWDKFSSKLVRFDCDLSQDLHDPDMKKHRVVHKPDVYYRQGLNTKQRKRILEAN